MANDVVVVREVTEEEDETVGSIETIWRSIFLVVAEEILNPEDDGAKAWIEGVQRAAPMRKIRVRIRRIVIMVIIC